MMNTVLNDRSTRCRLSAGVAILSVCCGSLAIARSPQDGDFEAALAAAGNRQTPVTATSSRTPGDSLGSSIAQGGRSGTSRYFRRNNLTPEERRSDPNHAARGLVPPEFRSKPATPADFEKAKMAILRRKMDPFAYLVGATAGTKLPPDARLIPCGGSDQRLFYTLGTEDQALLHNLALRRASTDVAMTMRAPKTTGPSPAAVIAKATAFLTANGYRAVPGWERNLYAPTDERPGQASVRVNVTENGALAMAHCGYAGEAPPPSGPGIEVRVHFPK